MTSVWPVTLPSQQPFDMRGQMKSEIMSKGTGPAALAKMDPEDPNPYQDKDPLTPLSSN